MKRLATIAVMLLAVCVLTNSAFAQMDKIANLDIKAIQKLQFEEQGKDLVAKNVLVFANAGDSEIKLRNANFKVSLKSGSKTIPMGEGLVEELVFPAGTAEEPAEPTKEMVLTVGPKNDETVSRLISLFNVIGDPASKFTMVLEGTSEVGFKAERGWIYQKGITVELEFQPSIQREVLFK